MVQVSLTDELPTTIHMDLDPIYRVWLATTYTPEMANDIVSLPAGASPAAERHHAMVYLECLRQGCGGRPPAVVGPDGTYPWTPNASTADGEMTVATVVSVAAATLITCCIGGLGLLSLFEWIGTRF